MKNIELRISSFSVDKADDNTMTVSGYVNKTEQLSHVLGNAKKFREKVAKGTFAKAISYKNNISLLYEHDHTKTLADVKSGSLSLIEDEEGLFMSAKIVNTSWGKDCYELLKAGLIAGASFGFRVLKDKWEKVNGEYIRTLLDIELIECTITGNPAYPQSLISARGLNVVEDIDIPEIEEVEIKEETEEERTINEQLLTGILEQMKATNEILTTLTTKPKTEATPAVEPTPAENEAVEIAPLQETVPGETISEKQEEVNETNIDNSEAKQEEIVQAPPIVETPVEEVKEEPKSVDLTAYKQILEDIQKGE